MDWDIYIGQTARIYRNLNNGRMSIQVKLNRSWKVVGHVTSAVMGDVKFHVGEAGRQRVIRTRHKNVHAWGEGLLLSETDGSIYAPIHLAYNPYLDTSFKQGGTDNSISACSFLVVRSNRVFVTEDAIDTQAVQLSLLQCDVDGKNL